MTLDRRELELKDKGEVATWELLVPIHADNFALALASGYVGGSLKGDPARDLQGFSGKGLLGFIGEVPSWAISEGESGDRILLSLEGKGEISPAFGSMETLDGPIRITKLKAAYFKDAAALENFNASYDAFPDVPVNIVELATKWPVVENTERPEGLLEKPVQGLEQRRDLDFFGGFAAGIVGLLRQSTFDEEICGFLLEPGKGVVGNARNLLLAIEPRSSQVDIAIWTATVEALRSRFGNRGFDRRDFLADVEGRLGIADPEAASWVRGCQRVINAEIDIPSLDDGEKSGRRAALALMLSQEPSGLEELESNLEAGPRVCALAAVAVYAFTGFSRIDRNLKSPTEKMEAMLEVGERMSRADPVRVEINTYRTGNDLTRHQVIKIAGNKVFERQVEAPAYLAVLIARIKEAGYRVESDGTSGQIGIRTASAKGEFIVVEDSTWSSPGNPVVNLVLPITFLGRRPTIASLKKLMLVAWENATTIALREVGEAEEVVAMATLPLATLDRDELSFHVEGLLRVTAELRGKRRAGRRVKS